MKVIVKESTDFRQKKSVCRDRVNAVMQSESYNLNRFQPDFVAAGSESFQVSVIKLNLLFIIFSLDWYTHVGYPLNTSACLRMGPKSLHVTLLHDVAGRAGAPRLTFLI